jgi:hypothetical protein
MVSEYFVLLNSTSELDGRDADFENMALNCSQADLNFDLREHHRYSTKQNILNCRLTYLTSSNTLLPLVQGSRGFPKTSKFYPIILLYSV